jgi:hypothetical protein
MRLNYIPEFNRTNSIGVTVAQKTAVADQNDELRPTTPVLLHFVTVNSQLL